ncbi:MAG: hypothetical protein ACK5MU_04440 [Candidatus Saccharimonadales bacterium]
MIGVTVAATGLPPMQQASAVSNDVEVSFKVVNDNFMAQIITPNEGDINYSDGGVTSKISYANAQTIKVYLTYPDGHQELINTFMPGDESGNFELDLPVNEYGNYTIMVSGTNMAGEAMSGDAKAFSYRAVTAGVNEDGDKVEVGYGSNVCKLGFQVYEITDTAREKPLLDPEYMLEVEQTGEIPNFTEIEIPGLAELGPDEFTVVVTAYDCLSDDVIDLDEVIMNGVIQPPKTGAISILGVTISKQDYLVAGLVVFVFAAGCGIFLLSRRKKSKR